jgi:hypothetical protein
LALELTVIEAVSDSWHWTGKPRIVAIVVSTYGIISVIILLNAG